jgi:hypothetical protein
MAPSVAEPPTSQLASCANAGVLARKRVASCAQICFFLTSLSPPHRKKVRPLKPGAFEP